MRFLMLSLFGLAIIVFGTALSGSAGTGKLRISSPAFRQGGTIPVQYTCDGKDISPPLLIEGVPEQSKSLVLIVDDPDAPMGLWVHWVVWNISPETSHIRENSVPGKSVQGINDFRKHDYGGPCPPSGTHRYFFKVYALDTVLNISPDSDKPDLEKAMKGHILSTAELMARYKRK